MSSMMSTPPSSSQIARTWPRNPPNHLSGLCEGCMRVLGAHPCSTGYPVLACGGPWRAMLHGHVAWACCMVMLHGRWCMGDGAMGDGAWAMLHGHVAWAMLHGRWCMGDGAMGDGAMACVLRTPVRNSAVGISRSARHNNDNNDNNAFNQNNEGGRGAPSSAQQTKDTTHRVAQHTAESCLCVRMGWNSAAQAHTVGKKDGAGFGVGKHTPWKKDRAERTGRAGTHRGRSPI